MSDILAPSSSALFDHVALIGGGQIGTSLALAIVKNDSAPRVTILDNSPQALEEIRTAFTKEGLPMDRVTITGNPEDITAPSLSVFAVPMNQIDAAFRNVAPILGQSVITDVASVKEPAIGLIETAAQACLGRAVPYVPFHILNGNSGTGPLTAQSSVFAAPGVIVPGVAPDAITNKVVAFFASTGTKIVEMSAAKHDEVLANLSHLRHVVEFTRAHTRAMADMGCMRGLLDPGNWIGAQFRIANAGPDMWASIFHYNKQNVVEASKQFYMHLKAVTFEPLGFHCATAAADGFGLSMPSKNIVPFDLRDYRGEKLAHSAFASLLSATFGSHLDKLAKGWRINVADIINPSAKDGFGPHAVDPENAFDVVQMVLKHDPRRLYDMVDNFRHQLWQTITTLNVAETPKGQAEIKTMVERARTAHGAFRVALQAPQGPAPAGRPNTYRLGG